MASFNKNKSQVKSNSIDSNDRGKLSESEHRQIISRNNAESNSAEFDDVPHKLPQPSGIYEAKLAESILRLELQGELDPMLKERWDALYTSFRTKLSSFAKDKVFPADAIPPNEGASMGSSQYCYDKDEALAIDILAEKNRNLTKRTSALSSKIDAFAFDEESRSHNSSNSEMEDDELAQIERDVRAIGKEILENETAIAKLEKSQEERRKLRVIANVTNPLHSAETMSRNYGQVPNLEPEGSATNREGNLHGMITYARMFAMGMKAELIEAKEKCNAPPHSTDEPLDLESTAEKLALYTMLEKWFDDQILALEQCDEIREIGSQCRMRNLRARFDYPRPPPPPKMEE